MTKEDLQTLHKAIVTTQACMLLGIDSERAKELSNAALDIISKAQKELEATEQETEQLAALRDVINKADMTLESGGEIKPPECKINEADWWFKELQDVSGSYTLGRGITAETKRAAGIAIKILRGETYDEPSGEWIPRRSAQPLSVDLPDTRAAYWVFDLVGPMNNTQELVLRDFEKLKEMKSTERLTGYIRNLRNLYMLRDLSEAEAVIVKRDWDKNSNLSALDLAKMFVDAMKVKP